MSARADGDSGGGGGAAPAHPPDSSRWRRFGASAGIVSAVVLIADLWTLASAPSLYAPASDVAAYLDTNRVLTLVISYVGALASVLLLPYVAALRVFVHERSEEAEWRWTVTILSGAVAVGVLLVACALRGSAALLAGRGGDEVAIRTVFVAAKVVFSFALVPLGAIVLSNARTISDAGPAVRWLIRFSVEIGVVASLSGAAVFFGGSDWFGPGEPMVAGASLLVALWLIATSVTLLQGPQSHDSSRP